MTHPHSLSSEEREMSSRNSCTQVRGDVRSGMTQSLIEHTLRGQSTGPAIYSHHLARRTTRPAENSCDGKSGHPVQPRQCHSKPRRNRYGGNPILCCNLPCTSVRWKIKSSSSSAPQSAAAESIWVKTSAVV